MKQIVENRFVLFVLFVLYIYHYDTQTEYTQRYPYQYTHLSARCRQAGEVHEIQSGRLFGRIRAMYSLDQLPAVQDGGSDLCEG